MATLGIFTVKLFHRHEGRYYTNGGFGDYLAGMCRVFDRVVMLCKVRETPPPSGFYRVDHPNLTIVTIPGWPTELGAMAVQPLAYMRGVRAMADVDVIHARMPDWTGVTGALVARRLGKPCFHQIVGDTGALARTIPLTKGFGLGAGLRLALGLYDWCERRVSRGQMVFAQGKAAYEKHHQAAERHLVLSTAHSLKDMGQVTPRCAGDRLRILAVGRLQAVKNQQLLIRALARLRAQDPRWELCILGEGPKRAELEALADELGVRAHVHMPGGVSHGPDLWRAYDEADIFAHPSVSEGTPKVVLEAMARGCPVVASDVGGIPSAVEDGVRGILVPPEDLDRLVAALAHMAADAAFRADCQNAAWAFAKHHTIEESDRYLADQVVRRWPTLSPLRSR
ncbi:glycosyltransferase [Sphingomonas suaedae]|uniref:Glycosyltransferase n=1 Tax=Sphingomonas suaedae TaxID=2599297 RepID=A0A518RJ45_9SPHN|nr:glycosyltransferase [Sphingomonas suaedae]QDX27464.1 glycosyltransferase [Sphingomonas suaedae]